MGELYIGLMSGTSLDGVDGVLAEFDGPVLAVHAHAHRPSLIELRTIIGWPAPNAPAGPAPLRGKHSRDKRCAE